jgi:2-desacetyl-2-hydroxyethyl bacteriochlorophyllide A dehydrogenase
VVERSRAAVLETPRRIGLVDRPRPAPGPGQALVRIAATAICHTDLEIYTGRHPGVRYPVVMGHEATGVVEAVGAGVTRIDVGQSVLINPIIACGGCDSCARGLGHLCRRAGLLGREMDGALAEHVLVGAEYLYPLPPGLAPDVATLIETLATVHHAQRRAGVEPGDTVVVFGQGASGLLHTQLAKISGAAQVIGISRSPWKLELARRMKADHALDAGRSELVAEATRLSGGRGADLVIDTSGDPRVLGPAMEMLRPGGRLLLYAISHQPLGALSPFPLYFKELTIYGARALTPDDVEPSIRLVASGAIDVDGFVTGHYPLERVGAAFEDYERDPDRVLRLVVVGRRD